MLASSFRFLWLLVLLVVPGNCISKVLVMIERGEREALRCRKEREGRGRELMVVREEGRKRKVELKRRKFGALVA